MMLCQCFGSALVNVIFGMARVIVDRAFVWLRTPFLRQKGLCHHE
jgi:hypothetical protein